MGRRSATLLALLACVVAPAQAGASTGGATYEAPAAPTARAHVVDGLAVAAAGTPRRVRQVIAAANRIARMPYVYGGGHQDLGRRWTRGYDCSGALSYALHGAGLLDGALDSSGLARWAVRGRGRWITVYGNRGHAFMTVAGLRFDTAMHDAGLPGPGTGPRWSVVARSAKGFTARHPAGL